MTVFQRKHLYLLIPLIISISYLSCASADTRTRSELEEIRRYVQGLGLTDTDFYAAGGEYNVVVDAGFLGIGRKVGSIQPRNGINTLPDALDDWDRITVLGRVKVDKNYRGAEGGRWNYWAVVRRTVGGQTQYRSVYVADEGEHVNWAPGFGRVRPNHTHPDPRTYWVKNSDAEAWGSCGAFCCCDDGTCRSPMFEAR